MAVEIASAYVSLSADTRQIPKDVRKALGQAEGAASSSGQSIGQKISSGLGKTLKAGALTGGAAAGAALGMSLKKGFDRLSAIEQSEAKLSGLGHSTESVAKIMDNALGSVKGTAYGLGDAASVAAGMVAAGIKPGKELEGVLKTMGDTAAIAGRDLTDVGLIFQSIAAKGKLQGDDMMQLMSSGIPVLQLLGDELGKTSEEVSEMVSNGEIDFETFERAMKKGMGGAALEAGKTFKGSMDNMGAAMGRFGETLLKGAFNKAPDVIGRVTDGIDALNDKVGGAIELFSTGDFTGDIGEKLGVGEDSAVVDRILSARDAVEKMRGAVELFFTGDFNGSIRERLGVEEDSKLVDDILNVRDVFADWGERVGDVFSQIGEMAKQLAPSFGSIATSLGAAVAKVSAATWESLLRILEALVPVLEAVLVPAFEKLAGVMEDNPRLVEALVFAFMGMKVVKGLTGPVGKMVGLFGSLGGKAKSAGTFLGAVPSLFRGAGDAAKAAGNPVGNLFKFFFSGTKIGGAFSKVMGGLSRVFKPFSGILKPVGSALSKMLGPVTRLVGGLGAKGLLGILGKFALRAVPVVGAIWLVVDALKLFFTKTEIGRQIWEGFTNWLSGAWDWIKEKAGAVFGWLGEFIPGIWQGIKDHVVLKWNELSGFLSGAWSVFTSVVGAVWGYIKNLITSPWTTLWGTVVTAWNAVSGWISGAWAGFTGFVASVWQGFKNIIRGAWNGLIGIVVGVWNTVVGWITGAWNGFRAFISGAWNGFIGVIRSIWNGLTGVISGAWNAAKGWISGAWGAFSGFISGIWNGFKSIIGNAWNAAKDRVISIGQGMLDGIKSKFNSIVDTVKGIKGRITGALSGAVNWLKGIGGNIIQGLKNGLEDKIKTIGEWFLNKLPKFIRGPFEKALDIHSPSRVFRSYGNFIGDGLVLGLEDSASAVAAAAQGMANEVASANMPSLSVDSQAVTPVAPAPAAAPATRGAPPALAASASFDVAAGSMQASVTGTITPSMEMADGAIGTFGQNVMNTAQAVVTPAMTNAGNAIDSFGNKVITTAQGIINPQINGMSSNIMSKAVGVINPAMAAVRYGLTQTGAWMTNRVQTVMNPQWNAMGANMQRVWWAVTNPNLIAMRNGLTQTASWLQSRVQTVMNPMWNNMGANIQRVWTAAVNPTFGALRNGLTQLSGWFGTTVNNIRTAWNRLRGATGRPAKFVIDTVMNNGIRNAWNAVADLIGEKKMNPVPTIGGFASGGVLPGYTPGRDVHHFSSPTGGRLSLSGGEAIMRPEWTRAVGGPKAVAEMNAAARTGSLKKKRGKYATDHEHFADGGIWQSLWGAAKTAFPNATLNSSYRPGASGYHGRGAAVDLGGPMQQIANWIYKTYPNSAQLIWGPGPLLYNVGGQKISDQAQLRNQVYAGDLPGHYDHVHWASDGPITSGGKMISMAGGSAGAAMMVSMADMAKEAWDGEIKKIRSYSGPGEFGAMPNKFKKAASEKAWGYLKKQADKMEAGPDAPGGAGAERWRPMIKKAFAFQGEQGTKPRVDALVRQIWTESKGDPNIAQQIVDDNGTGESAGVGLYQVIPTTWEGYRDKRLSADRRNAWAQHNFAVRYFRDRHNWNMGPGGVGRGHGWKSGGVLPSNLPAALFDNGGYLQDGQVGQNQSGKPEPVFTHKQWQILKGNIMSAAQAGDLKKLQINLGIVANGLQQAVAKLDWNEIFGAASKAFNEKFFDDQAADVRSVFGIPDPDSIPAVKAYAEFRENEKKLNDEQAQAAKDSREAATRADSAADKIRGAPVPVKAKSESVSVGSQVARTGALVSRALANPNPVSVGAAASSAGQTVNFIVRNEEAAWSEYRKFQAKNSRGRVGAR